MRSTHAAINRAIAVLIRYGLLKSGGKYDQFKRLYAITSRGQKSTYGITVAQYPSLGDVKDLAFAIYNHPELLLNSPSWVLRYGKGRLKLVDNRLVLPSDQITLSNISTDDFETEEQVTNAILETLAGCGIDPVAIKVHKKGNVLVRIAIAAYVYFESAYHARCAIIPLKNLGRVSLGQTTVTSRVVASKPIDAVKMLLTEADGMLAQEFTPEELKYLDDSFQLEVLIQEWIDKDGHVSFLKIKLIDLSFHIFKTGESRVSHLLEFVGDESECRRFYPALVDQFKTCNETTFSLVNGLSISVTFALTSGDHKAAWAKTGRSGGHDQRDLFSDYTSACRYHLVAYQSKPDFKYTRYVTSWKAINAEMYKWRAAQIEAKVITTKAAEKIQLLKLYNTYGRVERVPALAFGDKEERPSVYNQLFLTPLVLHNQSYCCLVTVNLCLRHIVVKDSKMLKKLRGRMKGLVDGLGTTKCATSGSGIRRLINDALILEPDTKEGYEKYSPMWYLMDTICHHLRLKGRTEDGQHFALMDHERLCFVACTYLWWAITGDLSTKVGGRVLKKSVKNHLEDKIYAYELVNACPEWEEHVKIPLSMIDESIFEASFSPRDEMINCIRSKIGIEAERKMSTFKDMVNNIAPKKQYRSIMTGLPRHLRRNIVIRACWRNQLKWSFNIGTGLLPRIAQYSYHERVTLSTAQDIYLNVKGPRDPFYTNDSSIPDLIIDPCGKCTQVTPPAEFPIPLALWWVIKKLKRARTFHTLCKTYTQRLVVGHLKRARGYSAFLHAQLELDDENKQLTSEIIRRYEAYNMYRARYENDLPEFKATPRLLAIIAADVANIRTVSIWNGDITNLPNNLADINTDRTWTVPRIKSVLRYFRLRGIQDIEKVALSGRRQQLISRIIPLLEQYKLMDHLPGEYQASDDNTVC